MEISNNNEINFIFKINKITYLLNILIFITKKKF